MKIAVDVCVGRRGVAILRAAGCDVLVADHGEPDRSWFERARRWGVDMVVSSDADLEILCYDNKVRFFRAEQGSDGREIARRALEDGMRNIPHVPPTMTLAELGTMLGTLKISLSVRAVGAKFEATVRNADGAATSTADTMPDAIRLAICDYTRDL